MNNTYISIKQSNRKDVKSTNRNNFTRQSHSSTSLKSNSNNHCFPERTKESNNKSPQISSHHTSRNSKSLKRTSQSKVTENNNDNNNDNNNNNTQIPKETTTEKRNIHKNKQQSFQTDDTNHPIALNHRHVQFNSPPIPPIPKQNAKQMIPRLDFSNLSMFQNESDYPMCPMAPRSIYTNRPNTLNGHITYTSTTAFPSTSRRHIDVKSLIQTYTITSLDKSSKLCCAICLCDFEENEKTAKLQCGHVFHEKCVLSWLNKGPSKPTCPMCRQHLFKIV